MKDFKAHFEAMRAAVEGDMSPAKELFKPKKVERSAPVSVPERVEERKSWMKVVEEKREKEAEQYAKLLEQAKAQHQSRN